MAVSVSRTAGYSIVLWLIIACCGNLTCIFSLLWHSHMFRRNETKSSRTETNLRATRTRNKNVYYRVMSVLTIVSMTGFTTATLIASINHFACILNFDKLTPVFYQIAKCCIYLGFIMRLYHVYGESSNTRINSLFLQLYTVLIVFIYSGLCVYGYLTMLHQVETINNMRICKKVLSNAYLIWSMCADPINTVLLLSLYNVPLLRVMRSLRQEFGAFSHYKGRDLKYPLIKVSILTSVATLASLCAHIISLWSGTYIAFLVDMPINVVCVMLMTPYYSIAYQRLCCVLIRMVELFEFDHESKTKTEKQKTDEKRKTENTAAPKRAQNEEKSKVHSKERNDSIRLDTARLHESQYETRTNDDDFAGELVPLKAIYCSEPTRTKVSTFAAQNSA